MTTWSRSGIMVALLALVSALPTNAVAQGASISVTFGVDSSWDGGYSGSITIANDGAEPVQGWVLSFIPGPEISSLWNGTIEYDGEFTRVLDAGWNATIPPGADVQLGFNGIGQLEPDVAECTLNGEACTVLYDIPGDPGDPGDPPGDPGDPPDDPGDQPGGGPGPFDCRGDLNNDGFVDGEDLAIILGDWGRAAESDIDGSGNVDGADLALLLAAWGECTGGRRIVGYYIEWGIYGRDYQPADMPLEKITHINYAFANISDDGRIAIGDPYAAVEKLYPGDAWDQPYAGTYNQLNNVLRAQYPHIRTLISVGGWTWSGRFSDVALTEQSRSIFASSCVDFIRQYNFDGVDIDWEYPVCCGLSGNTYRPEDKQNYTLLMKELRAQLDVAAAEDGREYLLTIAAPAGYDKLENLEMAELVAPLDWVNVMTYDLRGAWDLSLTAHHAQLFPSPSDPVGNPQIKEKYNVDWSINAWLDAGIPSTKVVMGVPFYGRAWGGVPAVNNGLFQPGSLIPPGTWDDGTSGATGVNDYFEIEQLIESGQYTRHWDSDAKAPYLYSPTQHGGHFISYEDEESLALKMDYLNSLNLGGVMFWEVTGDRTESLMDVIVGGLVGEDMKP